jgi:hypothetical protein
MFSKLIPCKSAGFEVQVTHDPRWQAPILLYSYPDTSETKIKKVNVKIQRNRTISSTTTYGKFYMLWTGNKVEEYCKFRIMLDKYIKQSPLNNVNEQVNAF